MNPVSSKLGFSSIAEVNLIPADIAEKRKFRAVRNLAVFVVIIATGVIAFAYVAVLAANGVAQLQLNAAVEQERVAVEQRDALSSVYADYVEREYDVLALAQASIGEVKIDAFTANILATSSTTARFETLNLSLPNAQQGAGGTPDLAFGGGIGVLTFDVVATSPEEATAFIGRLEAVPGIASVRASTEQFSEDEGNLYWRVSGTAAVTDKALQLRLVLIDETTGIDPLAVQIAQDAEPVVEESVAPTPSAEASAEAES